jgi:gliding motility-associated-like protein
MKKAVFTMLCWILAVGAWSQSSDCNTAQSVCQETYTQNNSPAGTGNVFELAPGSCQTAGEFNSAWYIFTVQEDGVLNFTLGPNSLLDDYDWSLYEITNGGCAGINNGTSPEVSCNSYGETFGNQGTTGISSASGGVGSSNGPGNTLGPPFNADLPVSQGEVYALSVMNYSSTLNGYSLDFGGSTAEIFDDTAPQIILAEPSCTQEAVTFTLSENIESSVFNLANLSLSQGGTTITIQSINPGSGEFTNSFTVNANTLDNFPGTVTLSFNSTPTDICGNALSSTYDFELPLLPQIEYTVTDACEGQGGVIEVEVINAEGCPDFNYGAVTDVTENCAFLTLSNLTPGTYVVSTTGQSCDDSESIIVGNTPLSITLGGDQELCDLQGTFEVIAPNGNINWLPTQGLTYSSSTNSSIQITASTPGVYTVVAEVSTNLCSNQDEVIITFNNPPQISIETISNSCYESCDGKAIFSDSNNTSMTVIIDGGITSTGTNVSIESLCAGEYEALVLFSPVCSASYQFDIVQPSPVNAAFTMDPAEVTTDEPVLFATSTSTNADSLSWAIVGLGDNLGNDSLFEYTLPQIAGDYVVRLTAIDTGGCINTAEQTFIIRDNFFVFIPNSFTPNDDGLNDFFIPKFSYEPEYYLLRIFNRWGELIFESTDYNIAWLGDANSNGYYNQIDAYVWSLEVKGRELEVENYNGVVTILR